MLCKTHCSDVEALSLVGKNLLKQLQFSVNKLVYANSLIHAKTPQLSLLSRT